MTAVQGPVWPATATGWIAIAALALVSTVAAIALFFAGLPKVGPTNASTLSTLEPAVSVALAAVILAEPITVMKVAGGALILAAVLVIARAQAGEAREAQGPGGVDAPGAARRAARP